MSYIWYPDIFFLRNFLMDLTAFATVAACMRIPAKKWTFMLAAAVSALCSVLLFYLLNNYLLYRGLVFGAVNPLMILLFFQPSDGWDFLKKWGATYLLLLLFGGIHTWLAGTGAAGQAGFVFGAVLCAGCGVLVTRFWRRRARETSFFQADLVWNKKRMRCIAYADTGNVLRDVYSGKAVSIIGEAELAQVFSDELQETAPRLIPFRTLGSDHGMLPVYTMDRLVIYTGGSGRIIDAPAIGVSGQGCVIGKRSCLLLHSEFCGGKQ